LLSFVAKPYLGTRDKSVIPLIPSKICLPSLMSTHVPPV
jgi:hypothetical protein